MPKSDNRRKREKLKGGKRQAPRAPAKATRTAEIDSCEGKMHQGMFEAPCGSIVQYMMTMYLPTMESYRHAAILDHLVHGECPAPTVCGSALSAGDF